MYDKILVPVDGSEHSLKALGVAAEIAKKFGGKITLIHVYSVAMAPVIVPEPATMTPTGAPYMMSVEMSKALEAAKRAGNRILVEAEEKIKAEEISVETVLKEGHVVQEIIKAAKEGDFKLIVIGARGVSHIREFLLGSVTDGVIHHAACPVLVVK
ncbi:MAG: universal stress protein [Candidatus Bathyarchaeota archaeon]|jgi:nucleotide-binding universal stress UspA family protein|nr:universal stress protein [Candidatus Bathyarchaeota archaeon]